MCKNIIEDLCSKKEQIDLKLNFILVLMNRIHSIDELLIEYGNAFWRLTGCPKVSLHAFTYNIRKESRVIECNYIYIIPHQ